MVANRVQRSALSAETADFAAFQRLTSTETRLEEWPLASAVEQRVLVYGGDAVRDACALPERRQALMAEWVAALTHGPGVLVIKDAFDDPAPLDAASAVFAQIIEAQQRSAQPSGDHFAKAGANDRIWNALQKHCLADAGSYAAYYANEAIALISEAWLGKAYQVTAQVNQVNPGGAAQSAHRDYHLGFMTPAQMQKYPVHAHQLSPMLTLQGAIAHVDMPLETGPTLYLPYSQQQLEGYLTIAEERYQRYFDGHHAQLAMNKGDAVFFNPALMHAAGSNRTSDQYRLANLLQVGSAFGRSIEAVDRARMLLDVYPVLLEAVEDDRFTQRQIDCIVAATAEGYPFPTNLDRDLPAGGLAPASQADLVHEALTARLSVEEFAAALDVHSEKRSA